MLFRCLMALVAVATMACSVVPEGVMDRAQFQPLSVLDLDAYARAQSVLPAEPGLSDADWGVARCDLNDDGAPELIIQGMDDAFCSPGLGCEFSILDSDGILILNAQGALTFSTSYTKAWRDLVVSIPGDAPAVLKFDGLHYVENLDGLAFDDADDGVAATGLADPWGYIEIAWQDGDHTAETSRFLSAFIQSQVDWHGAIPDDFRIGFVDLNADGVREVIVQGVGIGFCGSAGCSFWALSVDKDEITLLGKLNGYEVEVASSSYNGFRDLLAAERGGRYLSRFDGKAYHSLAEED